ncbi:MAG: oxidoreductase [Betaproteobacteria bacterium]|nr:oxidoreductase [Betaproteobacteria bacterium]
MPSPGLKDIRIGDLTVRRFGYGTAPLTGPGVWGYPTDRTEAIRAVRRAVDLGVNFIDTADTYGPYTAEELIHEALHPYSKDLVIATKGGQVRAGPGVWHPLGRPEYLRHSCDMSLRRLGQDCIDVYQLHRIDDKVPFEDQVGAMVDLQRAGKIRHIGASNVTIEQLVAFRKITPVVSVQALYNVRDRGNEDMLRVCESQGLVFLPWFPLNNGELVKPGGPLGPLAKRTGHTPAQLALAWLLHRSPSILLFAGTPLVREVEENFAAAKIELPPEIYAELDQLAVKKA